MRVLKVPGYIPDGYNFSMLTITNNPRNEYFVELVYLSDHDTAILIIQERLSQHDAVRQMTGAEKDFFIDGIRIFYSPCVVSGNRSIFAVTSEEMIQITGMFELDVLLKIFETMQ